MNGGTGPDTFQFTAVTGTMGTINGGTGTSTIIGPAQANTWNITGTNTGSIIGTLTTFNASTGTLNLTGGGTGDSFIFGTNGTINGTIDGTVGGAAASSITGPNANEFWSITGANTGTIGTTAGGSNVLNAFKNVDSLTGGSGNDLFTFTTAASSVTVKLDGGGGSNSIQGFNQAQTWDITAPNAGSIGTGTNLTNPPVANNIVKSFVNVQTLLGGNSNDTFVFSVGATMGTINGGSGITTIVGAAQNDTWNITGPDAGNITGVLNSFTTTPATATLNLTGGGVGDIFQFGIAGTLMGTINGTTAANATIVGPNANEFWSITGANAGTIGTAAGGTNVLMAFVNVANLTGGNGIDLFTFTAAASSVTGKLDGGGGSNTIQGFNQAQTWDITAPNAGSIGTGTNLTNPPVANNIVNSFLDIQTLDGGNANDTFVFAANATMGTINGGTGITTIVGPTGQSNTFNITNPNFGNITGVLTTFNAAAGTLNLTGGGVGDHFVFGLTGTINGTIDGTATGAAASTITGPNANEFFAITGTNAGAIVTAAAGTNILHAFKNVANLIGGNQNDTFTLAAGGTMGTITGGGGNDTIVTAANQTNTVNITGANAGNLTKTTIPGLVATTVLTSFVQIENLDGSTIVGNTGLDIYKFFAGGSLAGNFVGGTGSEWLDYDQLATSVQVNLTTERGSFIGRSLPMSRACRST